MTKREKVHIFMTRIQAKALLDLIDSFEEGRSLIDSGEEPSTGYRDCDRVAKLVSTKIFKELNRLEEES